MTTKNCVVCYKEYKSFDENQKGHGSKSRPKRRKDSVTCSPKCSKILNNVCIYLRNKEKLNKIRRKVVVVWGRFDENTDFVIEPATDNDKDFMYIEGERQ